MEPSSTSVTHTRDSTVRAPNVRSSTPFGPVATRALVAAVLAAMSLFGAACGSQSEVSEAQDRASGADSPGADSVPIEMTDVATGETTSLRAALTPADGKPLVVWFWAPFCPTCRGEAPELDEFMASNADRVAMVGIGTRDDLSQAREFRDDTGVSNFPLLWEGSGRAWTENEVAAQPYTILIDPDGEEVERWPGGASVTQIEDALAALS